MSCSSKSVQECSRSMSLLLNGGSFDQNKEYNPEFNEMVKVAERKIGKEKKYKKKGNQKKSSFDELLALQKQIDLQQEQNECYEKMMWETLEEQRKSDKEERDRDWEFFLQLGKVFSGSKQHTQFFSENLSMAMYWFVNACFKEKSGLKDRCFRLFEFAIRTFLLVKTCII